MFRRIILFLFAAVAAVYVFWTVALFVLKVVNPPTTGVQIQRRVESWVRHTPYRKRQTFVPLSKISPELQHAVISAEDGRFYQHHGIDWDETEKVAQETQEKGELIRGASTIPQQLVKNLFLHYASQSAAEIVRSIRWRRWRIAFWASGGSWSCT